MSDDERAVVIAAINRKHEEYVLFIRSLTRPACRAAASFSKAQAEQLIAGHRDGCDAAVYVIAEGRVVSHEDRLGPRDVAILMRGQREDGAGPCKLCDAYTASRYGVHTGCVARIRRLAPCGVCDQSGEVCSAWGRLVRCACCEGSGQRLAPTLADETAPCPRCKGAQEVDDRLCDFCDGEGVVLAGPIADGPESARRAAKVELR